jgi:HTH-type transcriptional regulator/antitoxin HigA
MRLIRRTAIQSFADRHPDAYEPLLHWANAVEGMTWKSAADLAQAFVSATFRGHMTVFHLMGARYPVTTLVHYDRDVVLITLGSESAEVDTKRYRRMLSKTLPSNIESAEENYRTLAVIEELMEKGEGNLTAEEDALLDLLADLVYDFEEIHIPFPATPPHKFLEFLLEQRGLKEKDLKSLFDAEGLVSELLSGSRTLTTDQVRPLAKFLTVGAQTLVAED